MLEIYSYKLSKKHKYCIYIQPHLYQFLKRQGKENINFFLEYLIEKFKSDLIAHKNLNSLKKSTDKFQPRTKDYKRIILQNIEPNLWKRLKKLKSMTGYSISFIIRILIEWEMQFKDCNIVPILPNLREYKNNYEIQNNFLAINNYIYYQFWEKRENEVIIIDYDFP